MKCLTERGYHIPEDVSVVSYDNTYMAEMGIPPLTSVDYNYEEYGRKNQFGGIVYIQKSDSVLAIDLSTGEVQPVEL